jgi:hypothetical protein
LQHAAIKATSSRSWPLPDCAGPNSWDCASAISTYWRGGSTSAKPRRKWKVESSSDHQKLAPPCEPSHSPKSS